VKIYDLNYKFLRLKTLIYLYIAEARRLNKIKTLKNATFRRTFAVVRVDKPFVIP